MTRHYTRAFSRVDEFVPHDDFTVAVAAFGEAVEAALPHNQVAVERSPLLERGYIVHVLYQARRDRKTGAEEWAPYAKSFAIITSDGRIMKDGVELGNVLEGSFQRAIRLAKSTYG